jgi:hypothetical protein
MIDPAVLVLFLNTRQKTDQFFLARGFCEDFKL